MTHPGGRPSDNAKFVADAYDCGLDTSEWLIYPKTVCEILNIDKATFEDISKLHDFPRAHIRGKSKRKMYKTGEIEEYAAKYR